MESVYFFWQLLVGASHQYGQVDYRFQEAQGVIYNEHFSFSSLLLLIPELTHT